jgi:hypothetical protein
MTVPTSSARVRSRVTRPVVLVLTALAVLVAGVSAAFAYWRSSGTGAGSATAGSMTINVVALQAGDTSGASTLIPGGSADVLLRVSNPNAFSVHVSAIVANGSIGASNGCPTAGISFTRPTDFSAGQFTLAPGSNLVRLSGAIGMTTSVSSACQGATFTIPVSVTVQR